MQFEFSLQTAILGSLGSSLILAGTLFYLWRLDPGRRPLFYWSLAFLMQSLRMAAQLGATLGLGTASLVADILFAGTVLLVWRGCQELAGRRFPTLAVVLPLSAALAWNLLGAGVEVSFLARTLPFYAVASGLLIHSGWLLHRLGQLQPGGGYGPLALLILLLGLHYLDYPFLRPLPGFAPFGFAIASLLMLGIGIVMLVITQRSDRAGRQEAESRYRVLVDELDEGIVVVEADLRVTTANPAAARLLGVPLAELQQQAISDTPYRLLHAEGVPAAARDYPLYRALRLGEACAGKTLLLERRDGSRLWLSISAHPLFRAGEKRPHAAILSFSDVSEQKAAEARLAESEQRFRSIFEEVANIAVQGYDRQGRIIYWNGASERFYGHRSTEVLGRHVDDVLPANDPDGLALHAAFDAWIADGVVPAPGEFEAQRKDGSRIRFYSTRAVISNIAGESELYCLDIDISDLRRLQDEVQEYSERFRAIAESSDLGVTVADEQGRFVYANPRYLEQTDTTTEDIAAGRWIDHLHPDDQEPMRERWRQAIATQTGFTMERRVCARDGRTIWSRAHIVPIHSARGVFRGFICTVEDITALKETERALRLSEAKFAGAFHASLDYITLSDLDTGELFEVNEAFERLTGWTREEAIGKRTVDLGIWVDEASRREAIDRVRTHGYLREYPMLVGTRDGRSIDCLLNASLISVDGRRYLLGVVRDVLAQKQAEEELRKSEEKFSRMVHYSPVALAVTDAASGVFVDFNEAWQEMFGYTRAEVIGRSSADFGLWFDNADRDALYRALKANHDELNRHECRYRRADGNPVFGLASGRLFDIGGRPCYLWSITDITLRHQVEQRMAQLNSELESRVAARTAELERAQDELIRAEKLASLGALVAGVAHELNTPIGNSVTVASTLHERTAEFAEAAAGGALRRSTLNAYLDTARTASDLLLRSLDQARNLVASFKQVAVDQTSDQRRRFDLREVVGEVLTTLSPTIRKTPFTVSMDIPEGIVLDSYPGPLGQVVTNFITNSLTHAFDGRNHGSVLVRAGVPEHGQVVMTISDDGVGIPEEHFRHIFDPFFTTKLGRGGSGLGLHIVYNIVTRVLGGRVSVDSQLGTGTTFMLTMPFRAPDSNDNNDRP